MERVAYSLLFLAFGLMGLSFLAASWGLECAEAYFLTGLATLIPALGGILLAAIGWQTDFQDLRPASQPS